MYLLKEYNSVLWLLWIMLQCIVALHIGIQMSESLLSILLSIPKNGVTGSYSSSQSFLPSNTNTSNV